ncbi:MAG: Uma2 family endonuclease [Pseudonocardia sp.]
MTAPPLQHPRLLTVAEFAALPEDNSVRYELQEGVLVMSPRPVPNHQRCLRRLMRWLEDQLPHHLEVLPEVDVDLELVHPTKPGFVRAPDLVVVGRTAVERVDDEGGPLRASDVALVVEILSPNSRRMDTVIKHGEYADAGIPHYWILDPDATITLTACHRAGEFGYADAVPVTGAFLTEIPFPVRLDLTALLSPLPRHTPPSGGP